MFIGVMLYSVYQAKKIEKARVLPVREVQGEFQNVPTKFDEDFQAAKKEKFDEDFQAAKKETFDVGCQSQKFDEDFKATKVIRQQEIAKYDAGCQGPVTYTSVGKPDGIYGRCQHLTQGFRRGWEVTREKHKSHGD